MLLSTDGVIKLSTNIKMSHLICHLFKGKQKRERDTITLFPFRSVIFLLSTRLLENKTKTLRSVLEKAHEAKQTFQNI
jgi:hypothetical protein